LDRLISANGQSAAPINDFVAVSNFDSELQSIRAIHDEIGAHLEIDDTRTLNSLVADLDGLDLEKARGLTDSLRMYSLRYVAPSSICGRMLSMASGCMA